MLRTFIATLFIMLLSCGRAEKKVQSTTLSALVAKEILHTNIQDIPVVDFEGLEPLLYRDDGKIYVINFWATWCAPCIKELPYFEKINEELGNSNVEVILVNLDMPKMWESNLIPFVNKKKLQSAVVVLDDTRQNTWIPKINENWSGAIPATLIYNGEQRSFYEQTFSYKELMTELNNFIKH